jgi:hypothetical protein
MKFNEGPWCASIYLAQCSPKFRRPDTTVGAEGDQYVGIAMQHVLMYLHQLCGHCWITKIATEFNLFKIGDKIRRKELFEVL